MLSNILSPQKLFVSYTLQDGEINKEFLQNLKIDFHKSCPFNTYIDLLDNHSTEHQSYVFENLLNSDYLLLILTSRALMSNWVKMEIDMANNNNIPIIVLPLAILLNMQQKNELDQLLNNKKLYS